MSSCRATNANPFGSGKTEYAITRVARARDLPGAITAERDSLRSALAESARTIEGIRDELMAADLDVSTDDDSATFAHHVFVLRMALEERGDLLATALAERDEARSRLAKAREEIEGLAAQLAASLKDLHATTPGEVIEARVVRKIADWLERTTEPNDPCDGHCIAAAIRANAWRSK